MNHTLKLFSGLALPVVAACTPAADANTAKATTYGLELKLCVDHAETMAQSRFCRCEVNKRYRRPCDD